MLLWLTSPLFYLCPSSSMFFVKNVKNFIIYIFFILNQDSIVILNCTDFHKNCIASTRCLLLRYLKLIFFLFPSPNFIKDLRHISIRWGASRAFGEWRQGRFQFPASLSEVQNTVRKKRSLSFFDVMLSILLFKRFLFSCSFSRHHKRLIWMVKLVRQDIMKGLCRDLRFINEESWWHHCSVVRC